MPQRKEPPLYSNELLIDVATCCQHQRLFAVKTLKQPSQVVHAAANEGVHAYPHHALEPLAGPLTATPLRRVQRGLVMAWLVQRVAQQDQLDAANKALASPSSCSGTHHIAPRRRRQSSLGGDAWPGNREHPELPLPTMPQTSFAHARRRPQPLKVPQHCIRRAYPVPPLFCSGSYYAPVIGLGTLLDLQVAGASKRGRPDYTPDAPSRLTEGRRKPDPRVTYLGGTDSGSRRQICHRYPSRQDIANEAPPLLLVSN